MSFKQEDFLILNGVIQNISLSENKICKTNHEYFRVLFEVVVLPSSVFPRHAKNCIFLVLPHQPRNRSTDKKFRLKP